MDEERLGEREAKWGQINYTPQEPGENVTQSYIRHNNIHSYQSLWLTVLIQNKLFIPLRTKFVLVKAQKMSALQKIGFIVSREILHR